MSPVGPSGTEQRYTYDTVVFDLGGVLLTWAPELPYAQVMPAADVPAFLAAIDFPSWNAAHDAGQAYEVGEQSLIQRFPGDAAAVRAYREHFDRSLTGLVPGTGAVLAELQQAGVRLLALTNWSAETFPHARRRFGLLDRFEAIVVSGEERLAKPAPAVFELLLHRHGVDPSRCVFVDDAPANVAAASALGISAVQFSGAAALRGELQARGLLGERPALAEPVFHLTERVEWRLAERAGSYPWSSRGLTYERQGFVHCSFGGQVEAVRQRVYPDVDRHDLLLLELRPDPVHHPVVVEDLGAGEAYPHLYAPMPLEAVQVSDLA